MLRLLRSVPCATLLVVTPTCQMTTSAAAEVVPLRVERFRPDARGFASYSGIDESLRVVIRADVEWRRYWQRLHARMTPAPPLPAVDFRRQMVVLAALGERRSGGYVIRIDSAYDASRWIEVVVQRTAPGERCFVTAALTQPVDVVSIPKRSGPVRFREREGVESC
jgi:hypothetical protein